MKIGKSVRNLVIAVVAMTATVLVTFGSLGTASAQAMPSVIIDPSAAPAGTTITFTGFGFAPGELVQADFGGETLFYVTAVNGSFQAQATLASDMPEGFHPMEIYGDMSWFELEYEVTAPLAPAYVPNPAVQVNPNQAYSGDIVAITGTGFDLGEVVEVNFAGVTIANAVAVNGDFQVSATLPTMVPAGAHPMDIYGNMGSYVTLSYTILAPAYVPNPAVQVNPSQAYSGDTVTITGTGFDLGEVVEVNFAGVTIANAVAVNGDFQVSATLPTMVPAGAHPMDIDGNMGSYVTLSYTILAPIYVPNPAVQVNPSQAYSGDGVTITGTGFDLGEVVEVSFAGVTIANAVAVNGDFQVSATLPTMVPAGAHPMDIDGNMGSYVTLSYTILAPVVVSQPTPVATPVPAFVPSPAVQVDPSQAYSGDLVTITGSGFDQGEVIEVNFAGVTIANAIAVRNAATPDGKFRVSATLPTAVPAGAHPMDINGNMGSSVTLSYTILAPVVVAQSTPVATPVPAYVPNPAAQVNPNQAYSGDIVTITGTGFDLGEVVEVNFAGVTIANAVAVNGDFQVSATLPTMVPAGAHPMDINGNMGSSVTLSYTILAPVVVAQPTPAPIISNPVVVAQVVIAPAVIVATSIQATPGSEIVIEGTGFQSGETIKFTFDGGLVGTKFTGNGSFTAKIRVPGDKSSRTYIIRATGDLGSKARVAFKVLPSAAPLLSPAITVSPTDAVSGGDVVVRGSNFADGELVQIRFGTKDLTVVLANGGTFKITVTLPTNVPAGTYPIIATGDAASTARAALSITDAAIAVGDPAITIAPTSALPGTLVVVTGTGFGQGETIELSIAGAVVATIVATDGTFAAEVSIPASASPYDYQISVAGDMGSKAQGLLTVVAAHQAVAIPSVEVDPSGASAGERVSVTGSGFQPGEIVEIVVGRVKLAEAVATDGTFRISLELPRDIPAGKYSLEARGNLGSSTTASLEIAEPVKADTDNTISILSTGPTQPAESVRGLNETMPSTEPTQPVESLRGLDEIRPLAETTQSLESLSVSDEATLTSTGPQSEVVAGGAQPAVAVELPQPTAKAPEAVETTEDGTLATIIRFLGSGLDRMLISGAVVGGLAALALGATVFLRAPIRRVMLSAAMTFAQILNRIRRLPTPSQVGSST